MKEYFAEYKGEFNVVRHIVIDAHHDDDAIKSAKRRLQTPSWKGFTLQWIRRLDILHVGPNILG